SFQCVQISSFGVAKVSGEQLAVFLQRFGKTEPDLLSACSLYAKADPADHILTHVHHIAVTRKLCNGYGRQVAHHLNRFIHLRFIDADRFLNIAGPEPAAVVKAWAVPARYLFTGVILFSVVFVVCPDGASRGAFPAFIRGDGSGAAVLIANR